MNLIHRHLFSVIIAGLMLLAACGKRSTPGSVPDYPIVPVPFTDIQVTDDFWLPRMLTNTEVTIPIAFRQSEETGRIKNPSAGGFAPTCITELNIARLVLFFGEIVPIKEALLNPDIEFINVAR